jgi:hypothetical protein
MNEKYVSDHGKIIYIIFKSSLHLNSCRVLEPFKAKHEFQNSLPINHTQNIRKYLSEQFQVNGLCSDDILSLPCGMEDNFQNCDVILPLKSI